MFQLLDLGQGNHLRIICLECWNRIYDFHQFHKFVIDVQTELIEKLQQIKTDRSNQTEELADYCFDRDVKDVEKTITVTDTELVDLYSSPSTPSVKAEITSNENQKISNHPTIQRDETCPMETYVVSDDSDDCESDDQILEEFEDSVGDFVGGDFIDEPEQKYSEIVLEENIPVELLQHHNSFDQLNTRLSKDINEEPKNQESFDTTSLPVRTKSTNSLAKDCYPSYSRCFQYDSSKKRSPEESDDLIAMWLPTLECNVCKEQHSTFTRLKEHFRQQHPRIEQFYVECCYKKLAYRCLVEEHVSLHLDPDSFRCRKCGKRFTSRSNLCTHKHVDCSPMTKTRERKHSLDMDAIIAQWKPTLSCVACNDAFENFTLLKRHFRKKHPKLSFYVTCCQRKFKDRHQLEEHIRVHLNPDFFKCTTCGKCFSKKRNLTMHLSKCQPQR